MTSSRRWLPSAMSTSSARSSGPVRGRGCAGLLRKAPATPPRTPACRRRQRLAGLLGVGLVPGAALFAKTQAQGIVLRLQAFQGTPQPVAVERLARLQQERLVPVLAVGNRLLEEPALYRRQRHLAACRPLFRRRRTPPWPPGARLRMFWCWNRSRGLSCNPAWRARLTTWIETIESPPRLKKLSSRPTRSTPSRSCQISARVRSTALRGAL